MSKSSGQDVVGQSALQIGSLIQSRAVDPEEVADRTLQAIEACEDKSIFVRVTAGRAMTEARASARRLNTGRSRGILDGVPVSWKDLFDLEGLVTTAASHMLDNNRPAEADAAVVQRLKRAGMVSVGRVNMTEFAFSGLGLNPHFGTPRNPHGQGEPRVPGGSSSGSGVAVARGLTPISIGTDTGGSIRVPASFNGVVGLKTSAGRYPLDGVFPLAPSIDTVGVLCRTVDDAILVDAALRGMISAAPQRQLLAGCHLVVPTNIVLDGCDPAVLSNFENSLSVFASAGVIVSRRPFPAFDEILDLFEKLSPLVSAEAFFTHRERLDLPNSIDRRVVARIRRGANLSASDYMALLSARRRLISGFEPLLTQNTFIAFPTTPHVAPEIAPLDADDELFHRVNLKTLRNTMLGNFLDWCGVALPNGTDDKGMPTSLLLSGGPGMDDHLLTFARSVESVLSDQKP